MPIPDNPVAYAAIAVFALAFVVIVLRFSPKSAPEPERVHDELPYPSEAQGGHPFTEHDAPIKPSPKPKRKPAPSPLPPARRKKR